MTRRFTPDKHIRIRREHEEKNQTTPQPRKETPIYEVVWRRGTRTTGRTDIFCIRFTIATEKDEVYYDLLAQFDKNLAFVSNWMYWYEVLLKDKMTWGEVIKLVDKAFMGKFP